MKVVRSETERMVSTGARVSPSAQCPAKAGPWIHMVVGRQLRGQNATVTKLRHKARAPTLL